MQDLVDGHDQRIAGTPETRNDLRQRARADTRRPQQVLEITDGGENVANDATRLHHCG
jgi:hypothetical protein